MSELGDIARDGAERPATPLESSNPRSLDALWREGIISYDFAQFLRDPCGYILIDSLQWEHESLSDAAKKESAKRRKERLELRQELRSLRPAGN